MNRESQSTSTSFCLLDASNKLFDEIWAEAIVHMFFYDVLNVQHFGLTLSQAYFFHFSKFWQSSGLRLLAVRRSDIFLSVHGAETYTLTG